MNEEYIEKPHAQNANKVSVLHQQLSRTLDDENFKSASIYLVGDSFGKSFPSEIKIRSVIGDEGEYVSYPILYQMQRIGDLRLGNGSTFHEENSMLSQVTKRIALVLKRFQATELKKHYIGKELCLAGYSDSLLALEDFIEKAASADCPVIINGPAGSETLSVACAIHSNSLISEQPFIEINCVSDSVATFQRQLLRGLKRAQGGCVFINGIDELSLEQQNVITDLLSSKAGLKQRFYANASPDNVRLIVGASRSLSELVKESEFSGRLFNELNFLSVVIPPLSERREDIPSIVEKLLSRYQVTPDQKFTNDAILAMQRYSWPENYRELERVVARVATMSYELQLSLEHLKKYAPEVLAEQTKPHTGGFKMRGKNGQESASELIDILLNQRFERLEDFHPGLQKALRYLSLNYCQEVTLNILSNNAFISPSHLSFLFKSTLSTSFKPLLAGMRIERAKQILEARPNSRITDVSLEVGFGDLSHFEKIFKRQTGMTPRDFKNQCKVT